MEKTVIIIKQLFKALAVKSVSDRWVGTHTLIQVIILSCMKHPRPAKGVGGVGTGLGRLHS